MSKETSLVLEAVGLKTTLTEVILMVEGKKIALTKEMGLCWLIFSQKAYKSIYLASVSAINLASISKGAPMFLLIFFKGALDRMGLRLAALLMGSTNLKFFLTVKGVTKR